MGNIKQVKIGFYKSDAKGRNEKYKIHMIYAFDQDWEEKSLSNRGLAGNRFFVRDATQEEERERNSQWRAFSYRYESLEKLVEDERRCGVEEKVIYGLVQSYKRFMSAADQLKLF